MKTKDISESFYDKMVGIFYDNIKELIDWDQVESFLPRRLKWYSKKKRCQVLLALQDAVSLYGGKFNHDETQMVYNVVSYMGNFRPTRSLLYMKSYRNHYLIDVFGLFILSYDDILKKSKYSHEAALSYVLNFEAKVMTDVADTFKDDSKRYLDLYKDTDEVDEDYQIALQDVMEACQEMMELAEIFKTNNLRAHSRLFSLIYDLQGMYSLAIAPKCKAFQDHSKYTEFTIEKKKNYLGEILSVIMEAISSTVECKYVVGTRLDSSTQKVFKHHTIFVNDDSGEPHSASILYENPCIIT